MPISHNENIIVIFGVAHSGTTILAKTLLQSPNIICLCNGPQKLVLENEELKSRSKMSIKRIEKFVLNNYQPNQYILMKRPWAESDPNFFKTHLFNAHYYCMVRDYHLVRKSVPHLTEEGYKTSLYYAYNFQKLTGVEHYSVIKFDDLKNKPQKIFKKIAKELGLKNTVFDVNNIGENKNVKRDIVKMSKQVANPLWKNFAQQNSPLDVIDFSPDVLEIKNLTNIPIKHKAILLHEKQINISNKINISNNSSTSFEYIFRAKKNIKLNIRGKSKVHKSILGRILKFLTWSKSGM